MHSRKTMTESLKRVYRVFRHAPGTLIMAALLAMAGCANDECFENKNSLPLAGFYSSDSVPKAIVLDSISVFGIGAPGDSILHDSVAGLKETYLPFRIDTGETSYVIRYLSGLPGKLHIADTISFIYEIKPWFVSSACGAVYYYEIASIRTTKHIIDSVTCPQGVIDNKNAENIRIYFRVSTENKN